MKDAELSIQLQRALVISDPVTEASGLDGRYWKINPGIRNTRNTPKAAENNPVRRREEEKAQAVKTQIKEIAPSKSTPPETFSIPGQFQPETPTPSEPEIDEMPTIEDFKTVLDAKLTQKFKEISDKIDPLTPEIQAIKEAQQKINDPLAEPRGKMDQKGAEYEKWLNDYKTECRKIDDNTWERPVVSLDGAISVTVQGNSNAPNYNPRFRPETMPKFAYGKDYDLWREEINVLVDLYDETIVCPKIAIHCFQEGETIKLWYLCLSPIIKHAVTKGPACWVRFKMAMSAKWSKPIGTKHNEADNRMKLAHETYTQYCIAKTSLCMSAHPDSDESTLIEKIRRRLDLEADRFCRETYDLNKFTDELVRYDEIVTRNRGNEVQKPNMAPNYRQQRQEPNTRHPEPFLDQRHPQTTRSGPRQSNPAPRQDPATRRMSVKDRPNPTTNKMECSFIDRWGKPIFIDRACDICMTKGQTKWHFRFECPDSPSMKSFTTRLLGDQEQAPIIEGLTTSPITGNQTSYMFSRNPITYASAIISYDDGYDTEDSGNGQGAQ